MHQLSRTSACCLLLALLSTQAADAADASMAGIKRVVFLGDSITQAGGYVVDAECWLLAHGIDVEVLNLGLGSETASDLTPEESAGHAKRYGFPRPAVSERLGRLLAAVKPDMVIACYGMNDGSELLANAAGTKRFADAVTALRTAILAAGAKRVVLASPPVAESKAADWEKNVHDQNLGRYTQWLLGQRAAGWEVVDIHTPMRKALDAARAQKPDFAFTKDGVHPGAEGHWVMASAVLEQAFAAKLEGMTAADRLFPANGADICRLVAERQGIRFAAWMGSIGHKRPGVFGGPSHKPAPSLAEAEAEAVKLTTKLTTLLARKSGKERK